MDKINLLQKILLVFSENVWMIYILLFLKFHMTTHAPSVGTIWWINVLDRFTKYVVLAILSLFGFFQLTKWGHPEWLFTIAINMVVVMINMFSVRSQVIRNYKYLKGKVVELYILKATDETVRYMLIEDGGRIVWDEITSNQILINTLKAEDGDTFFARIVSVQPLDKGMFKLEILQDKEFDQEIKRREEMKRRSGSLQD